MAEGLLRAMASERFEVASAGVAPSSVRPEAIEVMREIGIDISSHRSKSVDEFTGEQFDYVITVCDNAREHCPIFPGQAELIHWSFDDPAGAEGDETTRLEVFRRVRDEIKERLRVFTSPVLLSWNENAKYWIQYSDTIRVMFAPLTAALIEHAKIDEGQTILDVAGGSGEPGLTIAGKVGPGGSVTCTDAVAEMVEAARHEATRRGLANVQFRQCTADSLPFPDNFFDATVCRLGIMFVPDPMVAVREMLRVTKPGGKLALAVWHKSEVNPFCYLVTNVMAQHVNSPAADPDAPNAFRFAETGTLANVLAEAGASDVEERVVKFNIHAPISAREFWTMRSQTSDTLREKLAKLSPGEQAQIAGEVEQEVKAFFPHDQMNFPAQMILVNGTKAASPRK